MTPPTAEGLTLHACAAQLLFPRLGTWMDGGTTAEEAALTFEALIAEVPVGGALLFNGHVATTPTVLKRLQEKSPIPLLVAADMERGAGQQLQGATVFPHAMACGRAGDGSEEPVAHLARTTAREALTCGVHLVLAPVADIDRHPENPIIATRAFGETPTAVARSVEAYLRAAATEGALTVAKHFPGHGGTATDSHATLPKVPDDQPTLEATDLVPFRAAVTAGTAGLMSAHVAVPALDPTGCPATVSAPMLRYARESLRFTGLLVSDSLRMAAVTALYPDPGAVAVACVAAGIDVLLDPPYPQAAAEALVAAVAEGHLPEARLRRAAGRVLAAKRRLLDRFGAVIFQHPEAIYGPERVGCRRHQKRAEAVAQQAVEVAPHNAKLERPSSLAVVVLAAAERFLDRDETLREGVQVLASTVDYWQIPRHPTADQLTAVGEVINAVDQVLVVTVVQPAAWQHFGLSGPQQAWLQDLARTHPLWLGALGRPPHSDLPFTLCVATYSDVPVAQQALINALQDRFDDAPPHPANPVSRQASRGGR
ncbi:MAG: hypothetical protein GVY12_14965 [Bacteroidetes bacterium]|nr:hypothetical protein [Bacteroidota bacterium]